MRLYVSGPMTGLSEFNYPAFHAAKEGLQAAGYDVVSPADLPIRDDWEWVDYVLVDIDSVFAVDGIATLEGHEASKGARIECCIATNRRIPIGPVAEWVQLKQASAGRRSREAASPTEAQSNRGGSSERVREDREGRDNRDNRDDGDQRSDTDTDTGADDRDDLDRAHRGEHHHREEVDRRIGAAERDAQAGAEDPVQPSRGAEASG